MTLTFKPAWWSTLLVLGLCVIFIKLGFWQLDRAAQKNAKYAVYLAQAAQPVKDLNSTALVTDAAARDSLMWREITLSGHYQTHIQVLLDNQSYQGRAGYQVFSVLQWQPGQPQLWVNRGWLPLPGSGDRQALPDLTLATGEQTLRGRLTPPPAAPMLLQPESVEQLSPELWRVQRFDLAALADDAKPPMLPYVLTLTEPHHTGFQPIWQPPGNDAQKHYGYAFQWFAFTVALLIIYVSMNVRRAEKN